MDVRARQQYHYSCPPAPPAPFLPPSFSSSFFQHSRFYAPLSSAAVGTRCRSISSFRTQRIYAFPWLLRSSCTLLPCLQVLTAFAEKVTSTLPPLAFATCTSWVCKTCWYTVEVFPLPGACICLNLHGGLLTGEGVPSVHPVRANTLGKCIWDTFLKRSTTH